MALWSPEVYLGVLHNLEREKDKTKALKKGEEL